MPIIHEQDSRFAKYLAQYPEAKKWYDNLRRGSLVTAERSIPKLYLGLGRMGKTPPELLKMNPKDIQDALEKLVTDMEDEGRAPKYTRLMVSTIKSFCENNDIKLERRIKVKDGDTAISLESERVPKPSELDQTIAAGNLRAKTATCFVAYAGLRPKSLGNMDASDGLVLGDLPDLVISPDGSNASFKKYPAQVIVRAKLSKAGHRYFTFLNQKGCEILLAYLKERVNKWHEKLTPSTPVLLASGIGGHYERGFLATAGVSEIIRRAIRRAGFDWRPYVLRAYFDTQLLIAENNGLISRDFRVFFMGHKGDMERKYTLAKNMLPDDLITAMIDGYSRACTYLIGEVIDERERQINNLKTISNLLGLNPQSIDEIVSEAKKNPTKPLQTIAHEFSDKIVLARTANGAYHPGFSVQDPGIPIPAEMKQVALIRELRLQQRADGTLDTRPLNEMIAPRNSQVANATPDSIASSDKGSTARRVRIKASELDDYLSKGYDVSYELSNGDLIMKPATVG
jgi:hypothetical protein